MPEKVTLKYLEKVGFKSSNDRYILGILKFLGFVDSTGTPTMTWGDYRNRSAAGATLAAAMRQGYADLFKTYPDAHRKDSEALRNYFSAHTKVAESTLGLIVMTFKTLAAIADFEAAAVPGDEENRDENSTPLRRRAASAPRSESDTSPAKLGGPTININLEQKELEDLRKSPSGN